MRLRPQTVATHGGVGGGIDLSVSLNPLGPSRVALRAARAAALERYPELDAGELRRAAAARHGVPDDRVVPVPGGGFGLWLVMIDLLEPGDTCLALAPCFGEYRRCALIAAADYREVMAAPPSWEWDLDEVELQLRHDPRLCVIANPANPSGRTLAASVLRELCERHPAVTFLVDEAFAAFAPAGTSLIDGPTAAPENAVVVRSLTKELGLPGLRMGYLVASATAARALAGILPAWPVSAPSVAAAVAGMNDLAHVTEGARLAAEHVQALQEALSRASLEAIPTHANYLLVRAPGAVRSLAAQGVTVRDCASFGLADHFRIAAPTRLELPRVIKAIEGLRR